jgi:hypothetical protein
MVGHVTQCYSSRGIWVNVKLVSWVQENAFWRRQLLENGRLKHPRGIRIVDARLEVFTAVTMKNVVFSDIKPSSYFTGDTLLLR